MTQDGAGHVAPHRLAADLPAGETALRIIIDEPPPLPAPVRSRFP